MTDTTDAPSMLAPRYLHTEPVDPSLAPFFVQNSYTEGYVDVAMLTLVLYNARYVSKSLSAYQRSFLIGITCSDDAR